MVTAAIIAGEDSRRLLDLLSELLSNFEEIIIVDNGISPQVLKTPLARKAKLFKNKEKSFAALRNFAMLKARYDWVFFVDADEKLEPGLAEEVKKKVKMTDCVAFSIKRREFFQGREVRFGEVWKARSKGIIRLVRKGGGEWKGRVHEVFVPKGRVGRLKKAFLHYSHSSVSDFLKKVNYYSTLRAKELYENGIRFNFLELLFFPFLKFTYTYFLLLGFLDGFAGFVYSFMMSFHSFLVRAKLYQYWRFEE